MHAMIYESSKDLGFEIGVLIHDLRVNLLPEYHSYFLILRYHIILMFMYHSYHHDFNEGTQYNSPRRLVGAIASFLCGQKAITHHLTSHHK